MLFLLLSGAIFGACSPDKDRVPVFVKNVVMPPDSWVFAPGDGVTVSAEGFEADDEIMLEIHWQESAGGFAPEGYAKGVRGIVTASLSSSYIANASSNRIGRHSSLESAFPADNRSAR